MGAERTLSIALLAISLIFSLLASIAREVLGLWPTVGLLAIATLAAPLAFIIFKWGDWLIPYFTRAQRVITTTEAEVDIPLTEDVIVKQEGGTFIAAAFLGIRIFRSVTTMEEGEKRTFMDLWERALSGLNSVTKYSLLVYLKDMSKYRESIEERKAKVQMEIARESEKKAPDPVALDTLERAVSMWDSMLSRLSVGEKPIGMVAFVHVSAKGSTRDGAIAAVRQNVNEVRGVVGTALNSEVVTLTGDDMKRCFDWSYTVPASSADI